MVKVLNKYWKLEKYFEMREVIQLVQHLKTDTQASENSEASYSFRWQWRW